MRRFEKRCYTKSAFKLTPISPMLYSNPKSFVNFLLPPREFGEGWGGVKNLRVI
jgi:hypothetical protein